MRLLDSLVRRNEHRTNGAFGRVCRARAQLLTPHRRQSNELLRTCKAARKATKTKERKVGSGTLLRNAAAHLSRARAHASDWQELITKLLNLLDHNDELLQVLDENITRAEAARAVQEAGLASCVVRLSSTDRKRYVLTWAASDGLCHSPLMHDSRGWHVDMLDDTPFAFSIPDLVRKLCLAPIPVLKRKAKAPVQAQPKLQEQEKNHDVYAHVLSVQAQLQNEAHYAPIDDYN